MILGSSCFSQDPWRSFENGEYNNVIESYVEDDLNSLNSSDFNLIGSSYYRLGNPKKAAFYYFLGLERNHRNGELIHNYELISRKKYIDKKFMNTRTFITFLFFLVIGILLSFFIFPRWRRNIFSSVVLASVLIGIIYLKKQSPDLNKYIIIEKPTQLKSGIDPNALVYEEISPGEIFIKVGKIGNKVKVLDSATGRSGWIE